MFLRRINLLLCLNAVVRCTAAFQDFGYQDLIDPTNGTDTYGRIVNETRLVLKLDRSNFTEDDSWTGVDAGVIYDFSIVDPPLKLPGAGKESVILWTPSLSHKQFEHGVPFWQPGPRLGWTPFTEHLDLEVEADTTIDDYLAEYADYELKWEPQVGLIHSDNLENEHGWNITRVVYVNGEIMGQPGQPPQTNISAAAVYVMETEDRPYEFVWWEIVPLSWAMDWDGINWFRNADVPKSLEEKLLEGAQLKVEFK